MINKGGRPKIKIDFKKVQLLAGMFCTGEEIASVLDVDYDTLNSRILEKFGVPFSEYIKRYNQTGKASLRRMQYKSAQEGNSTMLIWLGKQYLNQKDKKDIDGNLKLNVISEVFQEILDESDEE